VIRRPGRSTTSPGKAKAYVPDRGDVIWIDLDPQAGREQAGRRTCLVLSPAAYNGKTGLAILCPITNQAKGYPFEVPLPEGLTTTGVVLADHIKSLDWRARTAAFREKIPEALVREVLDTTVALLRPEDDEEEAVKNAGAP
jgi:mRNA interferase MazF